MKILFFILFVISFSSLASNKGYGNIAQSSEVDECIKKFKSENIECLDDIVSQSENMLNDVFERKLEEIAKINPERWWMGNEQQKKIMLENLKINQKEWIDYRNNYCGVALSKYQNLDSLGEAQASCELKMNKRRVEEINMIDAQPDE